LCRAMSSVDTRLVPLFSLRKVQNFAASAKEET